MSFKKNLVTIAMHSGEAEAALDMAALADLH